MFGDRKLFETMSTRGEVSRMRELRRSVYLDFLGFPMPDGSYFNSEQEGNERLAIHEDTVYVIRRDHWDTLTVLGVYNPLKKPEGKCAYGFDPAEKSEEIWKKLDKMIDEGSVSMQWRIAQARAAKNN